MKRTPTLTRYKAQLIIVAGVLIILAGLCVNQFIYVNQAHSSFENYYAFRGCQQLLTKTDTSATCRLRDGRVIKMVKFQNKWYLDGDLPVCWLGNSLCL